MTIGPRCSPDSSWRPASASSFFHATPRPTSRPSPENWRRFALFLRNEQRQDGWWVVGLWLVMAATSLTKGLLGYVLPLMVLGVYSCLADGWAELGRRLSRGPVLGRIGWLIGRNRWLFNWKSLVAIPLGAAIYYVPFAVSAARTGSEKGLEMVYRENVVRFFHPFDHRGPIYLYLLRHLRPDDAVVGVLARRARRGPSQARCRPHRRRPTQPSLRAGLFLGDVHFLHAFRIAPQLLSVADSAGRSTAGCADAGLAVRGAIAAGATLARRWLRSHRDRGCRRRAS